MPLAGLWLGLLGLLGLMGGCGGGDPRVSADDAAPASHPVATALRLSGVPTETFGGKPDFVLTDTEGQPFDFREATRDRTTLLFFGYTSCPDICPVHLANVAAVLRKLPRDVGRAVTVVFVAVDPPRDTPERIRTWLDHFDGRFVGLTGTPAELEAAQVAAGVPPAYADGEGDDYIVSHAGWISLYTHDGRAELRYPFGTRQHEWAHDLEVLVETGWPEV